MEIKKVLSKYLGAIVMFIFSTWSFYINVPGIGTFFLVFGVVLTLLRLVIKDETAITKESQSTITAEQIQQIKDNYAETEVSDYSEGYSNGWHGACDLVIKTIEVKN